MKSIRELRRERGWTQFELALAIGVQPQTVYLWESGRRQPQVSQMRKLGEVFGMCSDDIDLESRREPFRDVPSLSGDRRQIGETAQQRDDIGRVLMRDMNETNASGGSRQRANPLFYRGRKDSKDGRP